MMPGMDPRQMQAMMRQMGINVKDVDASEVIIKGKDKIYVVSDPKVQLIDMKGEQSFQISGKVTEKTSLFSEEDVKLLIEKTGCTSEIAKQTLTKNNGDLAQSIIDLSN
ncbi:Nascent polypeptide-associated complex protein [uncultured archaeon]|nr:Nascent polypeptide-associated complex protein [uncultured archaeon]